MNLYLLSRDPDTVDYDEYDSAVVAALNEDDARVTHPEFKSGDVPQDPSHYFPKYNKRSCWVSDPETLEVTLIGVAVEGTKPGTILGSFTGY